MLTRSMIPPQTNRRAAGPADLSRLDKQKVHGQVAQQKENAAKDGKPNDVAP